MKIDVAPDTSQLKTVESPVKTVPELAASVIVGACAWSAAARVTMTLETDTINDTQGFDRSFDDQKYGTNERLVRAHLRHEGAPVGQIRAESPNGSRKVHGAV